MIIGPNAPDPVDPTVTNPVDPAVTNPEFDEAMFAGCYKIDDDNEVD
jgi:hypothetical protein